MRKVIILLIVATILVFCGGADAKVKKFVGIGILFKGDNAMTITYVAKGGPAHRAGIKEGDIIVKVDGKSFKNKKKFYKLMRGKVGTPVKLNFLHKGESNSVTLVREVVPIYTAYNIWIHKYMKCINYKIGDFIPAGTEISSALYYYYNDNTKFDYINLILNNNKKYKISFTKRYHPNKKVGDYLNYMVGFKSIDELTHNLTKKEIGAIKQGKIIIGMSKKAVLISYGRPAEHKTPDLKSNKWIYFINKFKQKVICFQNDLVIEYSER